LRRRTWRFGFLSLLLISGCATTPTGPDALDLLDQGRRLERLGRHPAALDAYRAARKAAPTRLSIHLAYQDLAVRTGDWALAVAEYRVGRTGSIRKDRFLKARIGGEPKRTRELKALAEGGDETAARARVDLAHDHSDAGLHESARDAALEAIAILPGDPAAHLALGRAYEGLERFEDAGRAYGEALDRGAAPAAAWAGEARMLLRIGRPAAAAILLRKVPAGERGTFPYQSARAAVAEALGRQAEQLAALGEAVRLDPTDVGVRRALGLLLFRRGTDPGRAGVLLAPLSGEGSEDVEVLIASGRLDLEAGLAASAARKLARAAALGGAVRVELLRARLAAGQYEEAAATAVVDDPAALVLRARALRVLGRRDEAEADLDRALALSPDRDDALEELCGVLEDAGRLDELLRLLANRAPTAHTAAVRGRIALARQDVDTAEKEFGRAVSLGSDLPAVYLGLSEVMRRRRRAVERVRWLRTGLAQRPEEESLILALVDALSGDSEAEALAHALLRRDPVPPGARYRLARILLRRGAIGEGLRRAERAARERPQDAAVRATLGDAFAEARRPDEAAAAYEKALALDGECLLAHLGQARLLARLGSGTDAEKAYGRVLALDPWRDGARVELARLRLRRGDDPGVIEVLAPVLEADPPDPDALSLTALAQNRRGNVEAAIQALDRLRQIRPRSHEVHLRLGRLHKKAGNRPNARYHLRRAIVLGADETVVVPLIRELAADD